MARSRPGSPEFVQLEQRLVLLAWLNEQFGFASNRALLEGTRNVGEGFDDAGRSFLSFHLRARGQQVKISEADLARYDENLNHHLRAINERRSVPITLRYFQHLAALYAEVYLDRYFNARRTLLRSLNRFVRSRNSRKALGEPPDPLFADRDLGKLAFWMATGGGKTLLMHLNYRQFLHYNTESLDNILLLTPNEGLTAQHLDELTASSIPCRRFELNGSGMGLTGANTVLVIEITKLVEEKRGGGVTVPVEAFEGNNLILVDEAHKGSGGETWRGYRDALARTGFTFEYSATFGQALSAAGNDDLTAEYGKSIVFDYSYRYFHRDGFGKDFRILNLRNHPAEEQTELLLTGNLLSFYEQQRLFSMGGDALRPYHLERPLWVFVGSSVNAVYKEQRQKRSDVLTVARFLHHLLQNQHGWAVEAIDKLLAGTSGLVDPEGQDIFARKFESLRATGDDAEATYQKILQTVFHAPASGGLHLCDLRGHPGELALKAGDTAEYFGLIYIGDTNEFKKLVEADDSGIVSGEDAIADALFDGINDPESSIEILIGAKKFIEGWNSWRVSSMGLLNIGSSAGSQIIQLFGRGVRLRGRDHSLKRSAVLDGQHPDHIAALETLDIFAVRANYMAQFREYLEREGIETYGDVEFDLPLRTNDDFLAKGLVVPRVPANCRFEDEENLLLTADPALRVAVNLSLRVQALESGDDEVTATVITAGGEQPIPAESLALVDWDRIYLDLVEYKERRSMDNLAIPPDVPERILSTRQPAPLYSLTAEDATIRPRSFAGKARLEEAVLAILRKYVDRFYSDRRQRWETQRMVYAELDRNDANFQDYAVRVARTEDELIRAVQRLIEAADRVYEQDLNDLPSIHFDRHLYQPLLVERDGKIRSEPPGLKPSERDFVARLRAFCRAEHDLSLADCEVFLLRNLSRGKGIGFFEQRGFYPDFIVWVKTAAEQRIVFVEPHGMLHAAAYQHDDKARLHESLPELANAMAERTGTKNVSLDSYIISATPFVDLQPRYDDGSWDRRRFAAAHILFTDPDHVNDAIRALLGLGLAATDSA